MEPRRAQTPSIPMSPERWQHVDRLFQAALDIAPDERASYLRDACQDDPELRSEVESLIESHEQTGTFLDDGAGLSGLPQAGDTEAPERFGPYRLLRELGRGGMGRVYLAEQEGEGFRRQVAVKMVDPAGAGADVERRFRDERRILAGLEHPGIARFYDAGRSPDGRWFLALEYVEGEDLRTFVERRQLDLRARVELFLQVLDAVDFAHRRLVVHRDLKPGNVLVDAHGRAKLLDFGISKILDHDSAGEAETTRTQQRAFTLAYASPEQMRGERATIGTDIYSAGVMLYEILAGQRPFDQRQTTRPETDPEPPSAVATQRLSEHDRTGDLDAITLKALRSAPDSRYPSAASFAADLRRWLAGEPVEAHRGGRRYRLAKFAGRHRLALAATAAVLAAVVLGTVGVAWQAREAQRQRREAQRQRDEAQAQLARATAVNDFMNILLSVAAPPGRKFDVGELLDQGAVLVDRQFADNDVLRAEMQASIAGHFISAEDWNKATPLLERAAETARKSGDPALKGRVLCPLAFLKVMNADRAAGDALMNEALATLPADAEHALARAECLETRSSFGYFSDNAEPMIQDATAALALLDQVPAPAQLSRINALANLAYGYYLARHYRQADEAYQRLWALLEQKGLERTGLASSLFNNWALLHCVGDITRAEALCRRSVELRRLIEGPQAILPVATFNHGGVLLRMGRLDEAKLLFEETVATAAARDEQRIRFDAMMALAEVYIEQGDLERGARQLSLVARSANHPRFDAWRRAQLLHYQGCLALARGEHAHAQVLFAQAVQEFDRKKAKFAMYVLALIGLARAEQGVGREADALAAAHRALALAESFVDEAAPSYLVGLARLAEADIHRANGRSTAAQASFRLAHDHLQRTLGPLHRATVDAREGM